jgi:hypothetical protein
MATKRKLSPQLRFHLFSMESSTAETPIDYRGADFRQVKNSFLETVKIRFSCKCKDFNY